MTKKEKHAAYLGITLFLLAAIFSISLILGLLDFGHSTNIFYLFGKKLINSYGFCSILIPIFTLTAGIFCFSAKWTLQKAVALLISPIPFFTLAIAERTARKIATTDVSSVAFMKIIFLVLIAILLAVAEYLLAFIISSKIYAKKHNLKISSDDNSSDSDDFKTDFGNQSEISNSELSDDFADKAKLSRETQNLKENNFNNSSEEIWSLDDEGNVKNKTNEKEFAENSESEFDENQTENTEENFAEDFTNSENQKTETQTENFETQNANFAEKFVENSENSDELAENQNQQNAEETKYFDDPWNVTENATQTATENPQIKNQEKDYTQTLSSIFNKAQSQTPENSSELSENADDFNDDLDFDNIISSFEKDSIGFEENFEDNEPKNQEIHYEINFDEDDANDSFGEETANFGNETANSAEKTANLASTSENSAQEANFDDIFYIDDNNLDENDALTEQNDNDDLDNAINMALDLDEADSFADETDAYAGDDATETFRGEIGGFSKETGSWGGKTVTSSTTSNASFKQNGDFTNKTAAFDNKSENFAEQTDSFTNATTTSSNKPPVLAENRESTEESTNQKDKTIDFSELKNQNSQNQTSSLDEIFSKMDEDARQKVKEESLEEKSALNQNPQVQQNPQSQIQNQNLSVGKTAVITDENGNTRAIPVVPKKKRGPYQISTELLTKYEENPYWEIDDETKEAAKSLHETLAEFNIEAEVIAIRKGPVVTMFEILPAPGVNLNKIRSLQDNIALRLAAKSVRIVAPIPGKKAVGIEIPNKKRAVVSFRECIEENRTEWKKMQIPVVLGKDIEGTTQIMDLAKTPHLLIAGATGAGKSVCVNSMILSILYKRSPSDVKLILIDPKIVELSLYNGIGHLLTPVITEPKAAMQALNYCICEMERRYAVLKGMGCREIVGYNQKIKEQHIATEKLPYIIIVIDEFADLMATAGKQMEAAIARLAAKSRAVGIHLVLATQRPSVDVITGLIKANIPSRIAFMVASRTDSNIIIDKTGAEKLLGKGDMLYSSASDPFPIRIQGTLVSDKEVENVVDAVKDCWGEPDYIDDEIFIDDDENEDSEQASLFNDGADDPLYEKALDIVIQAGKASASYIQRKLSIGYNRAARLVELMEERGIVGPANGSKPREIIHIP